MKRKKDILDTLDEEAWSKPSIRFILLYIFIIICLTLWQEAGVRISGRYYSVIYIIQFFAPIYIIRQLYLFLLPSGKKKELWRIFLFITSVVLILTTLIWYAYFLESRHGNLYEWIF